MAKNIATLEGHPLSGGSFSGELEFAGDRDWIKVELSGSTAYQFFASFAATDSPSVGDVTLRILDANGNEVTAANNGGVGVNDFLLFTASQTGTYYIEIGAAGDTATGTYGVAVVGPHVKKNGYVLVEGDVNGDGKADFQIELRAVSKLVGTDFDL